MKQSILQAGNRVYVSGYSPFRGLAGIIQQVDMVDESEEPFCFYLVKLEKGNVHEVVWFLNDEVESISIRDTDGLNMNLEL